jgi:hypothetical protein
VAGAARVKSRPSRRRFWTLYLSSVGFGTAPGGEASLAHAGAKRDAGYVRASYPGDARPHPWIVPRLVLDCSSIVSRLVLDFSLCMPALGGSLFSVELGFGIAPLGAAWL